MRLGTTSRLVVVFGCLLLCVNSCDPYERFHDEGRALVNAAGISTNETSKLVLAGSDVNKRSTSIFGWTPLISAIYHHNEDVVDFLLRCGANPNIGDNDNRTALIWAIECWGTNTNVLLSLLAHGADPSIRNRLGTDAFTAARSRDNASVIVPILRAFEKKKPTALKLGADVQSAGWDACSDIQPLPAMPEACEV